MDAAVVPVPPSDVTTRAGDRHERGAGWFSHEKGKWDGLRGFAGCLDDVSAISDKPPPKSVGKRTLVHRAQWH